MLRIPRCLDSLLRDVGKVVSFTYGLIPETISVLISVGDQSTPEPYCSWKDYLS
jgi:hypothetical protein